MTLIDVPKDLIDLAILVVQLAIVAVLVWAGYESFKESGR